MKLITKYPNLPPPIEHSIFKLYDNIIQNPTDGMYSRRSARSVPSLIMPDAGRKGTIINATNTNTH